MKILRNKDKLSDEEVKDNILFKWPLKFKYKEHELVEKTKHLKPYGNTKVKV